MGTYAEWVAGKEVGIEWAPTMTSAEADLWAQGSKLDQIYYHSTSDEAAASIRSGGFRLDVGVKNGRALGDGVYLAENKEDANWGPARLNIRANVQNPSTYSEINRGNSLPLEFRGVARPAQYLPDEDGFIARSNWDWVWDLGEEHYPGLNSAERSSAVLSEMGIDAITDTRTHAGTCVFDPRNLVVVLGE